MKWFMSKIRKIRTYDCPCCGYPTLHSRGDYDICPLCEWEDDGQDDYDADEVLGGPNLDYSLTEARSNFKRYLSMYNPDKPEKGGRRGTLTEPARRIKLNIIESYNKIKSESDPKKQETHWENIRKSYQLLYASDIAYMDQILREHQLMKKKRKTDDNLLI